MSAAKKIGAGLTATVIAAATAFIVPWEGNKTTPYIDVVGVPTVCAGVTKNVDMGRLYSKEECSKLNAEHIEAHAAEVLSCVKVPLSQEEKVAMISLAYNVGASTLCRSKTFMPAVNRNLLYCDLYLLYGNIRVKKREVVNGKTTIVEKVEPLEGLMKRRRAERTLCLQGANYGE